MTIAQLLQPTRLTVAYPVAKRVKDAPARHRLTHDTPAQFRASYLVQGVAPRTRRGRR